MATKNKNPNNLTNRQIKQGYSTIKGDFNPVTGQKWSSSSSEKTSTSSTPSNSGGSSDSSSSPKVTTYKKTTSTTPVYGENSASVLAMQKELNSKYNAGLKEDSKYGPLTESAYKKYMGGATTDETGTTDATDGIETPETKSRLIYTDPYKPTESKSADQIQREMQRSAQGEIDSLNQYYDSLITEKKATNKENLSATNALSVMTGLSGSTEGVKANADTLGKNEKALAVINNERAVEVNKILSDIRKSALAESHTQLAEAKDNEADRIDYLTKAKEEAVTNLSALSKSGSGASLEGLRATLSADEYDALIRNVGGEEMAKAVLFESRPKDTVMGSPTLMGNKMVQAYQTADGKVKYESVDLPPGVNPVEVKSVEKTDNGIFIIKSDGTYSKIAGSAISDGAGNAGETKLYAGIDSKTATAVRSKVSKFATEPIVTNFNVINEGYNFAKSIPSTTTNPADDQALIYSFAKIMDPNSVVREGEYATAQKYVQSWVQAYGKGVEQALAGTGFLSQTARDNIKKVLDTKYKASETNYKNVLKQYGESINNLTGRKDGNKFLVDYSGAYSGGSGTSQIEYQGKLYDVDENGDMTPVE